MIAAVISHYIEQSSHCIEQSVK
ncbi:hypothetical protein MESS2_10046 [Mesorhizobium metallidurans STM 2683]|uniref:Uncharacterized protein n=1 Tax=Mesorhizobium metallidurans STM 2683 TaxID=1297569 RepID=M5EFA6_9HYPH|nr:hypothetical protein MESS2_10046 [Mesorhizobium metallidurans STM 2683]